MVDPEPGMSLFVVVRWRRAKNSRRENYPPTYGRYDTLYLESVYLLFVVPERICVTKLVLFVQLE
jgi:hypothetical protein